MVRTRALHRKYIQNARDAIVAILANSVRGNNRNQEFHDKDDNAVEDKPICLRGKFNKIAEYFIGFHKDFDSIAFCLQEAISDAVKKIFSENFMRRFGYLDRTNLILLKKRIDGDLNVPLWVEQAISVWEYQIKFNFQKNSGEDMMIGVFAKAFGSEISSSTLDLAYAYYQDSILPNLDYIGVADIEECQLIFKKQQTLVEQDFFIRQKLYEATKSRIFTWKLEKQTSDLQPLIKSERYGMYMPQERIQRHRPFLRFIHSSNRFSSPRDDQQTFCQSSNTIIRV